MKDENLSSSKNSRGVIGLIALFLCCVPSYVFAQYCTSTASNTTYSRINQVNLPGETITLNNTATTCAGYTDFTSGQSKPDLTTSNSYTLTTYYGSCSGSYNSGVAAWIDYNQDGDFADAGEKIGNVSSESQGPYAFNFTIPSGALTGNTTMRIILDEGSIPTIPCHTGYTWGETEDYTVTIGSGIPPICTNTPTALTESNIADVTADLNWTENSTATSWDMEYNTTNTFTGTPTIENTINNPYSLSGLTAVTTYYYKVRSDCGGSSSSWSSTGSFTTASTPLNYCTSTASNTTYSRINQVNLPGETVTLDNTATTCASYTDFTTGQDIPDLVNGNSYTLTTYYASCSGSYNSGVAAWIDYNQDGDFADAGEKIGNVSSESQGPYVFNFTIPIGASAGNTTLRIILDESSIPTNPCHTGYNWGETEDYTVTIGSSCSEPTTQVSGFSTNSITTNSMNYAFTRGNGTGGVMVVVKAGSAPTDPTVGTSYTASATYGSGNACGGGFVVYEGTAAGIGTATGNIALSGLSINTVYYFAIYEYNSAGTCYNMTELSASENTDCGALSDPTSLTAIGITSTSAYLGWTENGAATIWDIELGTSGFSPTGTPTANDVTDNPYSYGSLSATTSYDFYVRSECGGSNSAWVGPFNLTTSSTPNSFATELSSGWARAVTQGADGTYLYVGAANSDIQISNLNQSGGVIWSKTYGGSGSESAYSVVNAGDGGYVILGQTNSSTLTVAGTSNNDFMITKITAAGAHVWTRVIEGNSVSGPVSDEVRDATIIRNSDGTFSFTATSDGGTDMVFGHLTSAGVVTTVKDLSLRSGAYGYSLVQTIDGGWVVAGRYTFSGSEFFVVKISSVYALQWSMVWGDAVGGGQHEYGYTIVENAANDYTIFGITFAEGTTPGNMYAVRFTNSGTGPTVIWAKAFGDPTVTASLKDAIIASDGNYVVTGSVAAAGGGSYSDTYIMKINPANGNVIWQNQFVDDGVSNRQGDDVYEDSDGSFLVAGLGGFDMLKFASNGEMTASCINTVGTNVIEDLGPAYAAGPPNLISNTEGKSSNLFGTSNSTTSPTFVTYGTEVPSCNVVMLPIELTYFDAVCDEGRILCKWSTASETNNDFFTIERSRDGEYFENVSTIEGVGNSNKVNTYRFADEGFLSGTIYYRLKQTDFDGKSEYSEIRVVSCEGKNNRGNTIEVYPNPFESNVMMEFIGNSEQDYQVEIVNHLGQTVYSERVKRTSQKVTIRLNDILPNGTYFIKVYNDNEMFREKLIKLNSN